mgnify:CR=1 FL=1
MYRFNGINFNKDNIIIISELGSNIMENIYSDCFDEDKEVYFFDENFNGIDYYPKNPSIGGIIKMRNSNISTLKTTLISIVIGGRKGLTIMVDFSISDLENLECLDMLRTLVNYDLDCNIIMSIKSRNEINF